MQERAAVGWHVVARRARMLLAAWHVWAPCLILALAAAPVVWYMVPAYESHLGEDYEPLRTLRFLHSGGQEYHKYGAVPCLLLAPSYGATIAWWWLTGSFDGPSPDFPYGLKDPLWQLSVLIVQGRVLFLLLGIVMLGMFARNLQLLVPHRPSVALAMILCLATNFTLITLMPSTRPDGPALAFAAGALAMYWRVLALGLTVRRALWFAMLAVLAASSKEVAATIFVFPCLAVLWREWRDSRDDRPRRRTLLAAAATALATGVGGYALLNIVYAPAVWLKRMEFWLAGDGTNSAIWGGGIGAGASWLEYLQQIGSAVLDNLGPGGAIVAILSVGILLATRLPNRGMLALPLISLLQLGLLPLGYAHDRFYLPAALCAVPIVAVALQAMHRMIGTRTLLRRTAGALVAAALAVNLMFVAFVYVKLDQTGGVLIERHLAANLNPRDSVNVLDLHPQRGPSRLTLMGCQVDGRSIQQIVDDPSGRPEWIYAEAGVLGFIEDCAKYPARARMLWRDAAFEFDRWPGMEGLGYRLDATLSPRVPSWFLLEWMPAARTAQRHGSVLVYKRDD